MTMDALNPYSGLGGGNGGHWNALAQAQSYSTQSTYNAYAGTLPSSTAIPARPAIKDAGIRAGEIIAYRAWAWKDGLLWSMAASFAWIPGEVAHGDPDQGVGVHAFKTMGDAVGQYSSHGESYFPVIFGRVALWGTVIEHEKGYRAEFGAIEAILAKTGRDTSFPKWKFWKKPTSILADVRRIYGIAND